MDSRIFSILVLTLSLTHLSAAQLEEKYSKRYDNLNVDLLFSSRLLRHYVDCLLDKKPCAPEGKDLKREFSFLPIVCR